METYLEDLEELSVRISQEAALITDVQSDLCNAFAQIIGDVGVCRESGMLIARNVPSLESVTPNQFTLFPTQTNIKVAVEGFWSGITDGITKIFELIFELIFGVLKLLVKPFEWLFGASSSNSSGGATASAEATVSALDDKEIQKVIDEVPKKEAEEIVDKIVDTTKINRFEYGFLANPESDIFNVVNDGIEKIYDVMVHHMERFTADILTLQGGNEFALELHDIRASILSASDVLVKVTNKFFGAIPTTIGYKSGDISTLPEARTSSAALELMLRTMEDVYVEDIILKKHIVDALGNLKVKVSVYEASLNFKDSDEDVYKSIDKYTAKFEKLSNAVKKLANLDFEKRGITSEQVTDIKNVITEHRKYITDANSLIRTQTMISIKGKRALFKGIKLLKTSVIKTAKASRRKPTSDDFLFAL